VNPYLVELVAAVSKYFSETEKNLDRVFAAAETVAVVLLFDEADSLFGKRSEVRDAHDRYDNIEVNYPLRRIQRFGSIAILATTLTAATALGLCLIHGSRRPR
jgi:SpoVK/Ycf46/Vps4 family AAA+-type ATPase